MGNLGSTIASPKEGAQFYSPEAAQSLPGRLKLPYPDGEIASGDEEDVSFIRDGFTSWVKADLTLFWNDMWSTFERPSRNIAKHLSEDTTHLLKSITSTAQECYFDSSVPNRSSSLLPLGHSSAPFQDANWGRTHRRFPGPLYRSIVGRHFIDDDLQLDQGLPCHEPTAWLRLSDPQDRSSCCPAQHTCHVYTSVRVLPMFSMAFARLCDDTASCSIR